jgi:DNA polymerase-3 subunit gamma/tau
MADADAKGLPDAVPDRQDGAYRVLARKYRPQSFADLIGQEALVRTLTNAIESGRVAQAYILTGVRGVGKTTTARILAKALNYTGPDGKAGPTAGPTDDCPICRAIAEDRHVDVIEMDAASRTGVGDIRELIEGVRYRPVEARYKVYIIDEVHMLSTNAFNALLKTLEEPPPHVVFIFATTEIRKVPVTVLSRCQRFDLRRVEQAVLAGHFRRIAKREGVSADEAAIQMIARAADGSVRDGLSLLDQAIALTGRVVDEASVKAMLGLADRARVYDLLDAVLGGKAAESLAILKDLYDGGADPVTVLQDLLEAVHFVTRAKLVPGSLDSPGTPETERLRGRRLSEALGAAELARAWQILLKGHGEAQQAPLPLQAAEMVLIRLAHAADLPTPGDLVKQLLEGGAGAGSRPAPGGNGGGMRAQGGGAPAQDAVAGTPRPGEPQAAAPTARPTVELTSFQALVALVRQQRELQLAAHLESDVSLVGFAAGRLELFPVQGLPPDFLPRLGRLLGEWTGRAWSVVTAPAPGEPPLRAQAKAAAERRQAEALQHPLAQALLRTFPGARLVAHRKPEPSDALAAPPLPGPEGDATSAPTPAADYASDDDLTALIIEGAERDDD